MTNETMSSKAFVDAKYKTTIHDEASFETIAKGAWSPATEDPSSRYGASKLVHTMMMHELQRRMDPDPELKNICILGVGK